VSVQLAGSSPSTLESQSSLELPPHPGSIIPFGAVSQLSVM